MIYFLYGEDNYRSKKKLDEIIDGYKKAHKSGLNLIRLDAKEKQFSDFTDFFKVVSMFAEKKLVILINIFINAKFGEEFLKNLKHFNEAKDIIVIYEKEPVDERVKLFKTLVKETKHQEFKFLSGAKLTAWVDAELAKYSAKIDLLAKNVFLGRVGNNLWQAENDIKKLVYFAAGKIITKEDVLLLTKPKIENDIFKTIDAIAQKDKAQALSLLKKHIDSGDNVLYLLTMIAYQFKNLMLIKNNPQNCGLHPFVLRKNYGLAAQFSAEQLKKIYHQIFEIDLDIKTGKIEPELALELLISSL